MISNPITVAITISIFPHFLVAEKIMSLLEYTHNEQETQAEPFVLMSGICLLFSGHFAPGLLVNAFKSACPIRKFLARYANLIP
jgi:hypothetical protein